MEKQTQQNNQILNAKELLEHSKQNKQIKMVTSQVKSDYNYLLHDIQVNVQKRKNNEDDIYAKSQHLHTNIRRGNTILTSEDLKKIIILRKGFKKFFDLHLEYLTDDGNYLSNTQQQKQKKKKSLEENLCKYTIDPIYQSFQKKEGNIIHIYKLEKANGENGQISYFQDIDSWVICSKNVSMLVQNKNQIELYSKESRYKYASLIALQWFRILDKIQQQNPQIIIDMKTFMNQKTFVCEYCGNQTAQHLVKYENIDLHFYAIVDNNSYETCFPVEYSQNYFKQFNLSYCKYQKYTAYSIEEFNKIVHNLFVDIGSQPIEAEGEGSVLYFVQENNKTKEQKCLSLCKLKTLEYRFYRKLREKLKNYIKSDKNNDDSIYNQYKKQCKELSDVSPPPKDFEYYFNFAKKCFEYVKRNYSQREFLYKIMATNFIDFMECINNNEDILKKDIKLNQNSDEEEVEEQEEEQKQQQQQEEQKVNNKKQKLITVIPFSIPASGKTTFMKQLLNEQIPNAILHYVSSDQCRQECMDQLQAKNSKLSKDELFSKTQKQSSSLFESKVQQILFDISANTTQISQHILLLDKNHPPDAILNSINLINKNISNNTINKFVGLLPETNQQFKVGPIEYPFSLEYLITCISRAINRDEHETLTGEAVKKMGIVMCFFKFYKNFEIKKGPTGNIGNYFEEIIKIPYCGETQNFEDQINRDLRSEIITILKQIKFDKDENKYNGPLKQLLELLNKEKLVFPQIPFKVQYQQFKQSLEKIFQQ